VCIGRKVERLEQEEGSGRRRGPSGKMLDVEESSVYVRVTMSYIPSVSGVLCIIYLSIVIKVVVDWATNWRSSFVSTD
jgi:hypothetical protein